MNQGVKLLLSRMESNPEEFPLLLSGSYRANPWGSHLALILRDGDELGFVTPQEHKRLSEKYWAIQGENFTESVMKILFDLPDSKKEEPPF